MWEVQDRQRLHYPGKKKAYTLKNQIAVASNSHIEDVSESVPGGAHHELTLLRQTDLVSKLSAGEAAVMAKGYDGNCADYPDQKLYLPFKARCNCPLI